MNKKIVMLGMLLITSALYADTERPDGQPGSGDVFGHTFFSVRPPYQTAMPEKETNFRNRAHLKQDGWRGALEIVPFGGQSTRAKDLMRFFAPTPKTELVVDSNLKLDGTLIADIDPVHFGMNVFTPAGHYKSIIQFRPRQSFAGIGVTYQQYLDTHNCDPRWWLEVSMPFEWVQNDMRLTESIQISIGTRTGAQTMIEAFQGTTNFNVAFGEGFGFMNYGKINGPQTKAGIADIEVQIGYDFAESEQYHVEGYGGLLIPTGNKPAGEYVFEAIVGHNHHVAFELGWSGGVTLWQNCDQTRIVGVECAYNGRYFLPNTQQRSFDLIARPWSRYLLVYDANTHVNQWDPGINIFTQKVRVKPRFTNDFNLGFIYQASRYSAEIGYNVWYRQAESVALRDRWSTEYTNEYGVLDIGGIVIGRQFFNQASNIGNDNIGASVERETPYTIQASELDLNSAAHPGAISNTIYATLGYNCDLFCEYPAFLGIGGSYELSHVNTVLNRWRVWAKAGVSF